METKTKLLFSDKQFEKIKNAKICVVGIGGVGGYVVENLVRTGVQNLCIIDFDVIEKSNINRQIIALNSTLGLAKVEVMKNRILDINPNCNVQAINKKLTAENTQEFDLLQFDYVADCIDNMNSKIALIDYCQKNQIKIISALGAGNRYCLPNYAVEDIFETQNDRLGKVLRKKLRRRKITGSFPCVFCQDLVDIELPKPASVMWHPAVSGSTMSAYIINQIIKNN